MPTSLAEPAPVGACQDLAGFIDALWWCSTITVEMAAPARVMPERKVHLWTMAFHRGASPQNAGWRGRRLRKDGVCIFNSKCLPRTAAHLKTGLHSGAEPHVEPHVTERDWSSSAGLLLLLLTAAASAFPLYNTSVTSAPSEVSSSHSQGRLLLRWLTTQCVKRLYHNWEVTERVAPPIPPFSPGHLPVKAVGLSGRAVLLFVNTAHLCERTRPGCIYEPCNYAAGSSRSCCNSRAPDL